MSVSNNALKPLGSGREIVPDSVNSTVDSSGLESHLIFSFEKKKRRKLSKRSISDRFTTISFGIEISRSDKELRNLLNSFAFTEEQFIEGAQLVENVQQLRVEQDEKIRVKEVATMEANRKRKEVHQEYIRLVELGRIIFKNNPRFYGILGLKGAYIRRYSGWMFQVKHFLEFALEEPGISEEYSKYNVSRENIERGLQLLREFETLNEDKIRLTALAQDATFQKNREFRKLLAWWRNYKRVIVMLVEKYPYMKTKMDTVVPIWK